MIVELMLSLSVMDWLIIGGLSAVLVFAGRYLFGVLFLVMAGVIGLIAGFCLIFFQLLVFGLDRTERFYIRLRKVVEELDDSDLW